MFKNYIKVAFRTLAKKPGYTFINIFGLAIGLAACFMISLYVLDELSFDSMHAKAPDIYRLETEILKPDSSVDAFASSSISMSDYITQNVSGVEYTTNIWRTGYVIKQGTEYYFNDKYAYTDPNFFKVFDFPLVEGNTASVLKQAYEVVITEEMRDKYFGEQPALGQTLVFNDTIPFTVSGVMANFPSNSHIDFDILVSWATHEEGFRDGPAGATPFNDWLWLNNFTYLKVAEGTDMALMAQKTRSILMDNAEAAFGNSQLQGYAYLKPLQDIYLNPERVNQLGATGSLTNVYIFSVIALFVLAIACINFMNLATARSLERAKEVGLRKVVGSTRAGLIGQFLTEAVVISLLALVLALGLIVAVSEQFNYLAQKDLDISQLLSAQGLLSMLGITLLAGLLSGSYPAFALSGFSITRVLKGSFRTNKAGIRVRQSLVVLQFSISIILIVGTTVAFQQLRFMQQADVGFNTEQMLIINASAVPNTTMAANYQGLRETWQRETGLGPIALSNTVPSKGTSYLLSRSQAMAPGEQTTVFRSSIDPAFLEVYGIPLLAGRNFREGYAAEEDTAVILTLSAMKRFAFASPEEALDKWVMFGGDSLPVIGITEDIHFYSYREEVTPFSYTKSPNAYNYFSMQVNPAELQETLASLEAAWRSTFPGYPFEFSFLDEDFGEQFRADQQILQVFSIFTTLANLIACLGLFGLAAYMITQRYKEIGVRKVLGASTAQVMLLLNKDFTKLVLIAIVIATPLAWWLMRTWLSDFPNQVGMHPTVFIGGAVAALFIALITVSVQSIRAALSNPVNTLRNE